MHLRVGIVGCGRAGSLLALRLVQDGIGRVGGIILIDPDNVEEINLDGMFVSDRVVGHPKAVAVATMCQGLDSGCNVTPFVDNLADSAITSALSDCDVIFTTVDSNPTRLAIAAISARLSRVHIDCSSGATMQGQSYVAGHEIRAFVPGTAGCVACLGRDLQGVRDFRDGRKSAVNDLKQPIEKYVEGNDRGGRKTHADEIGACISDALHIFWGLLRGELRRSRYIRSNFDYSGLSRDMRSETGSRESCIICGNADIVGEPLT